MLREGFDVSNVCVIVPLRSSEAPILLEQVIGRGLRLMWREPEYADIKAEMRAGIAQKKVPSAHFDILHIVEHPAFLQFYEDLDQTMVMEETDETPREHILGDIIPVGLKKTTGSWISISPASSGIRKSCSPIADSPCRKATLLRGVWNSCKHKSNDTRER